MERLRKDFIHSVLLSAMGICIVREGRQSIYIDAILCRGYRTLTRIPDVRVMVHVKVWEGLMESSWQFLIQVSFGYIPYVNPFFCQIVLFQFRTPIGHKMPLGQFHLAYGECEI
jgi:hypothetical protein